MAFFTFDASQTLGRIRAIDTRRISIQVDSGELLRRARVSQLIALRLPGATEEWQIAIIEKVVRTPIDESGYADLEEADDLGDQTVDEAGEPSRIDISRETTLNTVRATLVGTVAGIVDGVPTFSRSLGQVPEIDTECFVLRDAQLQKFMNLLVKDKDAKHSLSIGKYVLDENAAAILDGNKFFQRHAALLGSTGCGKSWTVATILERISVLPSGNVIVFDLHGEYSTLSYARHLRVPGPEELGKSDARLLFLPYWYLNGEEIQALFIDRSEFTAHNQVVAIQSAVLAAKEAKAREQGVMDVAEWLTLDSPVPFDLESVVQRIEELNDEMIEGSRGQKQGPFFGQFSRLLVRLRSRVQDKRYGFLFSAPSDENEYDALARAMNRLMDYSEKDAHVKVIDFSEVPSEVLPVIVGLTARLIYQIQFWTDPEKRLPIALVCDEAHLYLPRYENLDPTERRAVENFEKIAKEGRKYGVGLLIVSQRPADISATILSQCNNVIAMRLSNARDQATVRDLMPESLVGLLDSLSALDVGEALVVGDSVLLPSRIRFDKPTDKPRSATIDFWDEWLKSGPKPTLVESVENLRRQVRSSESKAE